MQRTYKKLSNYSFCIGVYPVLELFSSPYRNTVSEVILHPKGSSNKGVEHIRQIASREQITVLEDEKKIQGVSKKGNVYAVAVFKKYEQILHQDQSHVVLVNPENRGNVGTIIRTISAFGINNLAIIKPGVDHFHPDVVRSSMGSLFNINLACFDSLEEYLVIYPDHQRIMFTTESRATPAQVKKGASLFSLIFGSESKGLNDSIIALGTAVTIPIQKDVDSLNLAVSVGIGAYEFTK